MAIKKPDNVHASCVVRIDAGPTPILLKARGINGVLRLGAGNYEIFLDQQLAPLVGTMTAEHRSATPGLSVTTLSVSPASRQLVFYDALNNPTDPAQGDGFTFALFNIVG